MEGDGDIFKSLPTSAELEKANVPFQFVAPDVDDMSKTLQPPAQIGSSESKPTTASSTSVVADSLPVPTPLSTRPNTAQSSVSELEKIPSKSLQAVQADDSDSDITEPLPSDHSDAEESVRKSPAKEMAKSLQVDKRKVANAKGAKLTPTSPLKEDEMQVDEEEIVRPPKKKKSTSKQESDKPAKVKSGLLKNRKINETQQITPMKKSLKQKTMASKKVGDGSATRDKTIFGNLPSFKTKKEISEKAKELAATKDKKPVSPLEQEPSRDSTSGTAAPAAASVNAAALAEPAPATMSNNQLDDLFDLPVQPVTQSKEHGSEKPVADLQNEPTLPITMNEIANSSASKNAVEASSPALPPSGVRTAVESATVNEPSSIVPGAADSTKEEKAAPAVAPSVRRVSFQAYKKRVSTVPGAASTPGTIAEEAGTTVSPTTSQTPALAIEPSAAAQPVLGGAIVQTPVTEKSQGELNRQAIKAEPLNDSATAPSPATTNSDLPVSSASAVPGKPRLSFAAYRQRATVVSKESVSPASKLQAIAKTPPAPTPSAPLPPPGASQVTTTPSSAETADALKPSPKSREALLQSAVSAKAEEETPKVEDEQEQEEGEVIADPSLEPGEVEMEAPAAQAESALGMRMGDVSPFYQSRHSREFPGALAKVFFSYSSIVPRLLAPSRRPINPIRRLRACGL